MPQSARRRLVSQPPAVTRAAAPTAVRDAAAERIPPLGASQRSPAASCAIREPALVEPRAIPGPGVAPAPTAPVNEVQGCV